MPANREHSIEFLANAIPELTNGQIYWLERVVTVFGAPKHFVLNRSDLFDQNILQNFGDAVRVHHCFSSEPFSKDKFEHVLTRVLSLNGKAAELADRGNPGHDLSVGSVKISLKTQANKSIRDDKLWVSKFMELGGGVWGSNPDDLIGLRQQYLDHLATYDRILSLRCLSKNPDWRYELVEIPKQLLMEAATGNLEMKLDSAQNPKPGYCYVTDSDGDTKYSLYFDGGGERKLQIKNMLKKYCKVHAEWSFSIPQE